MPPRRPLRPSTSPPQNRAPQQQGQRLKQQAAQARTEKLRGALQQLQARRAAAGADAAPVAPVAAAAPPLPLPPQPPAALAAPSSYGEPELELEDLFDDATLSLLARLRLGDQRSPGGAPQPVQLRTSADVHAAAQRALQEAAADPEMPLLARRAAPAAAATPATACGDLGSSAVAMQQRLEQLRASLRSPVPPPLLLPHQQPAQALFGTTEPRRQRLAAAEVVVTCPPSRRAAGTVLTAGEWGAGAEQAAPLLGTSHSPPYSSSGSAPGVRLAALLLQPEPPACAPAAGVFSGPDASRAGGQQLPPALAVPPLASRSGDPQRLAPPPGPQLPLGYGAATSTAAAHSIAPLPPAQGSSIDILEAFRSRRRQQAAAAQAASLADKYSRYLSLQQHAPPQQHTQQGAPASTPPPPHRVHRQPPPAPPGAASWAPAGGGCAGAQLQPPASSPGQSGDAGDILAAWRARRRQRAQQGAPSSTADFSSLLTLRPPAALPAASQPAAVLPSSTSLAEPQRLGLQPSGLFGIPQLPLGQPAAAALPVDAQQACTAAGPPAGAMQRGVGNAAAALALPLPTASAELSCQLPEQATQPAPLSGSCAAAVADAEGEQEQEAPPGPPGELALALYTGAAATSVDEAPSRQPSRPGSTASSARATPCSTLALDRWAAAGLGGCACAQPSMRWWTGGQQLGLCLEVCACFPPLLRSCCTSTGWSPGISRLLDDCIGGMLWGEGAAAPEPPAAAAAQQLATAGRSRDGSCTELHSQVAAQASCPDPADLGFQSAGNSPAGWSRGQPPGNGSGAAASGQQDGGSAVVAAARALLGEAVMLLDRGASASAAAAAPEYVAGAAAAEEQQPPVDEPQTPTVRAAPG